MGKPAKFTQADIKRAVSGVSQCGLPIRSVRIAENGSIEVSIGIANTPSSADTSVSDDQFEEMIKRAKAS